MHYISVNIQYIQHKIIHTQYLKLVTNLINLWDKIKVRSLSSETTPFFIGMEILSGLVFSSAFTESVNEIPNKNKNVNRILFIVVNFLTKVRFSIKRTQ